MPRLTFTRSLALLVVAGLFMYFILTMISGARELLTPGAWVRSGVGYKLADPARQNGEEFLQAARRRTIERLREALLTYAEKHEGRLPAHIFAPDFDSGLWKGLSPDGAWFGFVNGRRFEAPAMVIAYEPAAHGARRWVLLSDTSLVEMDSAELEERLKKEAAP